MMEQPDWGRAVRIRGIYGTDDVLIEELLICREAKNTVKKDC